MVYKKKKSKKDEEYGPEDDDYEDDEEEIDIDDEDEDEDYMPSETPKKKFIPKKKKSGKYEVRYQEETLAIIDTDTDEVVVSKTHREFKDDELVTMVIETKKLNDLEEIKKVVGV